MSVSVGDERVRTRATTNDGRRGAAADRFTSLGSAILATADTGNAPLRVADTVVASKGVMSSTLGEEVMILNPRAGVYHGLDPVGARVWELIQEPRTIEGLRDALLDEYEVEPARLEQDLIALLGSMRTNQLIDVSTAAASHGT
jgi:hypothetical protein